MAAALDKYMDLKGLRKERLAVLKTGVKHSLKRDFQFAFNSFNLGNTYLNISKYRKAIKVHDTSLAVFRELENRQGEGAGLGNLGRAYAALGNMPKAISLHEEALNISREIGDKKNEGCWLGNLGRAYAKLGDMRKALYYIRLSVELLSQIYPESHSSVIKEKELLKYLLRHS